MALSAQVKKIERPEPDAVVEPMPRPRSEFRSAFMITGLRMTGKALGIVKTLVIAAWFGASGALDAFWVAYMLPQIIPGLVLGVVTTAFIPSFMRSASNGEQNIDWRGLNTLFTLVAMVVVVLAVIVVLARDPIVTLMAPGLPQDVHVLAAQLTGLMAVAVVLFGINAIFSAIMQATHRFGIMSLESVITNVVIIAGAVFLSGPFGVHGLVYSVIGGFTLHMLLMVWANRDLIRRKLRPAFDFSHGDFRGSAGHMLPLLIGFLGATSMTIIDRIFVSTLESGAISILVYASMIAMLPMEVFGQAVFTAFYPGLSKNFADGRIPAMREAQVRGMRLMLFVMVPATAALILASDVIITLLFERGAFTADASRLTAATLAALAVGLPMRAVNYFNFRVFHARREPWTAVGIGLFGVSVNVMMDMLLIEPMGVVGIALATSIAMGACMVLSTILLQRRQQVSTVRPLAKPLGKLALMTLAFVGIAHVLIIAVSDLASALAQWQVLVLKLSAFLPAGAVFLLLGYVLKFEEVTTFARFILPGFKARGETS